MWGLVQEAPESCFAAPATLWPGQQTLQSIGHLLLLTLLNRLKQGRNSLNHGEKDLEGEQMLLGKFWLDPNML